MSALGAFMFWLVLIVVVLGAIAVGLALVLVSDRRDAFACRQPGHRRCPLCSGARS